MIERGIAEFGDPSITHNVEFSLHKSLRQQSFAFRNDRPSITARTIAKHGQLTISRPQERLLDNQGRVKNAAIIAETDSEIAAANLRESNGNEVSVDIDFLSPDPVAIFECKRVGVEEGMKKGPQSIEKAKQGAYVAKAVSSLQKVYDDNGKVWAFLPDRGNRPIIKPYQEIMAEILEGKRPLPSGFRLTVGITSNHGNWFTSDTANKELRVLAKSYDWLLFLTDQGLLEFANDCLFPPTGPFLPIRTAFLASYTGVSGKNRLTKVRIDADAAAAMEAYFSTNRAASDGWFNVISPAGASLDELHRQLNHLLEYGA